MSFDEKEIKVVDENILATIVFIGTLFVSLSLSYDKREKLKKNSGLFTNKQAKRIAVTNRIIVVIIALFYFQIDRETIGISREKNKDVSLLHAQAFIEFVAVITAIVALYITVKSNNEIEDIENPNI